MHTARYTALLLGLALLAVAPASGAEFYLRAEALDMTLPDGRVVTMWGFARDSAFGAGDGTVTVPGPALEVPPGDDTVTIYLDNNLATDPLSLVVPGQTALMTPVYHSGLTGEAARYNGRVRSLTHETPPGNAAPVAYTWTDVRPGTFIYHSGTHMACHVQMGLYGALIQDAGDSLAYPGVPYDSEVTLLYSEIDPDFHDAVATGNYGPGEAVTSPTGYTPRYYLINGKAFTAPFLPVEAGNAGDRVLVRFINAGLKTQTPVVHNHRMSVVGEDGYPYTWTKDLAGLQLPALKTRDVILTPDAAGVYAVYDRTLKLTNDTASPGGFLTYLRIR